MTKKENNLYFNKTVYTLKSKAVPEIHNNVIRKDGGTGGIKLVYNKKTFKTRRYKLFDTFFYIRVSLKSLNETKVYLRPFKKNWDVKRNKLSKNKWGKPKHPLTNMWLELEFDHHDTSRQIPLMKNEIDDHAFVKLLRNITNKFFIISNI